MSQSFTIGRVTADMELQWSVNQNAYVRFGLAENIGYGETARTQFLQVWAWGDDAKRLIQRGVKKGSLIWVSGQLELEAYKKQDGTTDKRLKVMLDNWGFIAAGKPKGSAAGETAETVKPIGADQTAEADKPNDTRPDGVIDGDRETLPE